MIDLNSTATRRHARSNEITQRVDVKHPLDERAVAVEAIIARLTANPPPDAERAGRSISASNVGDECERRIQLGVWPTFQPESPLTIRKAPLDEKTRVVFARGHETEPLVANWLRDAGFVLSTTTTVGDVSRQHGFIVARGDIKGFADGIVLDSPIALNAPAGGILWEHKTLGNKGFNASWRNGVIKYAPRYGAQAQILMAYMGAGSSLFSLLNADTGELAFELVPFDPIAAQAASDRAVRILQATRAGDLLPRVAADSDSFPCRYCRFKETCWG